MALINCPECKKEISDKSKSCPSCGYPLAITDDLSAVQESSNITAPQSPPTKKKAKGKGCLAVFFIMFFIVIVITAITGGFPNTADNTPTGNNSSSVPEETSVFDAFKDTSEEQKTEISNILSDCHIDNIKEITHDEMLQGMFTYTDENGYGVEEGYRINTNDANNVIVYIESGKVIGIKYADNILYDNGEIVSLLTDYIVTSQEWSQITSSSMDYVKSALVSPSTAKFPNRLFDSNEWKVWKQDGFVFVQSYVDAQNAFGATIRNNFQLKISGQTVVSFILNGEELLGA